MGNTDEVFNSLIFKGKYEGFTDFYDVNKREIYMSIIKIFEEFEKTKKNSLILHVNAEIRGVEWDTEFLFQRDESIILVRDVIPYFEENEEYEICQGIKKIHESLTNV